MATRTDLSPSTVSHDLAAGLVTSLVALPLCLGVALASGAPLLSGVLAGIVGGMLVGVLSGSQASVSGPAAGLTAVVAAQIAALGSFEAFLFAVMTAGLLQIGLGLARAGSLAVFVPSSVINGLMAAIGVILILKQIPHVLGHDPDPEGDMAFLQPDKANTFSELGRLLGQIQPGAAVVGLVSIAILVVWDRSRFLKSSNIPSALVVVPAGVGISLALRHFGGPWIIESSHLVQVPVTDSLAGLFRRMPSPDYAQWLNPKVYTAAVTIAAVASLESLLNLEATEKLDPQRRTSDPSRELISQGIGNLFAGLIGGLPITTVIVRSSVNINAGAKTRLATISHGALLLVSVVFLPAWLNTIPLSCLAAILLVTGTKLASPALVKRMWVEGRYQFIPFALTVVSIVLTDLLIGVLIGMMVSIGFILRSSVRRPLRRVVENHLGGDVIHIELATQVSFLNRAALTRVLNQIPRGGQVLLDAHNTDYIDPDLLSLIRDFKDHTAPARGVEVSLLGFRRRYLLYDETRYIDYSTRELQSTMTPRDVLQLLADGHERCRTGHRLTRDYSRQLSTTARGQHPLAVVLSCIDSRTPAELIFDLGMGDIFSVRIAGNVASRKVLGSVEYGCAVAGAKLILVMGHTRCGAVSTAVDLVSSSETVAAATGCQHLEYVVREIQQLTDPIACQNLPQLTDHERESFVDAVARRNVVRVVEQFLEQSQTLRNLVRDGRVAIVGAIYDVATGDLEFLPESGTNQETTPAPSVQTGQGGAVRFSGSSAGSLAATPTGGRDVKIEPRRLF